MMNLGFSHQSSPGTASLLASGSLEHEVAHLVGLCIVFLFAARLLGWLFEKVRLPKFTGELFAGALLGPTILGRVWPAGYDLLTFHTELGRAGFELVTYLGMLVFLVAVSNEGNTSYLRKYPQRPLAIGIVGLVATSLITALLTVAFWQLCALEQHFTSWRAVAFIIVATSMASVVIIARLLSHAGDKASALMLDVLFGALVNEVVALLLLSLLLREGDSSISATLIALVGAISALLFATTIGQPLLRKVVLFKVNENTDHGIVVARMLIYGMLGTVLAPMVGLSSIFGAVLGGVACGAAANAHTREVFSGIVNYIATPLFFFAIGFSYDFGGNVDLRLLGFIVFVPFCAKFAGLFIAGTCIKLKKSGRVVTSICFTPVGVTLIIVGQVAFNQGLVGETVMVAIVAAVAISGTLAAMLLTLTTSRYEPKTHELVNKLLEDASEHMPVELKTGCKEDALVEICTAAQNHNLFGNIAELHNMLRLREAQNTTGIGRHLAIAHAKPDESNPRALFLYSENGLEWDALDGEKVHVIVLVVVPETEANMHLEILRKLAQASEDAGYLEALERMASGLELVSVYRKALMNLL